ncbi:MAG: cytochrome c oxidase subunit 3 family protein [Zoogloeaceae bacterium]|nr:cytochrome c oxidase subunit 3 family protein [Rhodocyclaceae bacterium]MCP5236517.1 cytochrome c oxidase subunit 3 family protein [Zoogloeaceae bacterium]
MLCETANRLHPTSPAAVPRLPGDLAVWFFILAELLVFAVFFVAYAVARSRDTALFDAMQTGLDRNAGAINTVFLVTASWCVARAVAAAEARRQPATTTHWLVGAIACGAGFTLVKSAEYADKFAAGVTLSSDTFHMFYLSLTFFHFMHVILGMVVLVVLAFGASRGRYGPGRMNGLESGAAYWHMVDLVWLVLFPLVYVLH